MAYRFYRRAGVQTAFRAIACDELEQAIAECCDETTPTDEAIHSVRRRCKKLRALFRLVRPGFRTYARENAAIRNTARLLSTARDADVALQTFDKLQVRAEPVLKATAIQPIRAFLAGRTENSDHPDNRKALEDARLQLLDVRRRAPWFKLNGKGFRVVQDGLSRALAKAHAAHALAVEDPTPDTLHEWRKHVKDHWYHMRLLQPVWPAVLAPQINAARRLQDLLGEDHDLAVLADLMGRSRSDLDAAAIQIFTSLIDMQRKELRDKVHAIGDRLFAEAPDHLVQRIAAYWKAWRKPQQQRPRWYGALRVIEGVDDQAGEGG